MTATLGSSPTSSQPVVSSNVSFIATDGVTIVATRSGYTGGASYSVDGTSGNFTSGALVFNTSYFLRLTLVNPIGITNATSGLQTFGDIPAANPSAITTAAATYFGQTYSVTWTAPGAGTLARPVANVGTVYQNSVGLIILGGLSYTYTNTQTSASVDSGLYGIQVRFGLYSYNPIGDGTFIYATNLITQYQFSFSAIYGVEQGSGTTSILATSQNAARSQVLCTGNANNVQFTRWRLNIQLLPSKPTATLSYSYSCSDSFAGVNQFTWGTNGNPIQNPDAPGFTGAQTGSGSGTVTNGTIIYWEIVADCCSGSFNSYSCTLTLT
jgi:hypothetical protein